MNRKALIYDFETLSQDSVNCAVVSMAALVFEMKLLERGEYDYETLLSMTKFQKYNVEDQVKNYNKEIDPDTIDWWQKQGKEAIKKLKPSKDDVPVVESIKLITELVLEHDIHYVFTRNNTFDPIIVQTTAKAAGIRVPYAWWKIRDTKSFIMGLTYEMDIRDDFIPPGLEDKFIKHDPCHDIVMDVMRLQTILSVKMGE